MLDELRAELRTLADPAKTAFYPRFFKAGPGQYAEGDQFLGVTVPQQRALAKKYSHLWLGDIEKLITSPWHEERLTGLILLVNAYKRGSANARQEIYNFYMTHLGQVNNWDLVDSSAPYIVGPQLAASPYKMKVLSKLAASGNLWERRIAMLSTFHYIKQGRANEALIIADILLHDPHDLIQKAVGWMLRELGKRVDRQLLMDFLNRHAATMPRTTLRYAIEHFDSGTRQYYLALKDTKPARRVHP